MAASAASFSILAFTMLRRKSPWGAGSSVAEDVAEEPRLTPTFPQDYHLGALSWGWRLGGGYWGASYSSQRRNSFFPVDEKVVFSSFSSKKLFVLLVYILLSLEPIQNSLSKLSECPLPSATVRLQSLSLSASASAMAWLPKDCLSLFWSEGALEVSLLGNQNLFS